MIQKHTCLSLRLCVYQIGDKPNAGLDKLLPAFENITYNGELAYSLFLCLYNIMLTLLAIRRTSEIDVIMFEVAILFTFYSKLNYNYIIGFLHMRHVMCLPIMQ